MSQKIDYQTIEFGVLKQVYACGLGHLYITSDTDRTIMMPKHQWGSRIAQTREVAEGLKGEEVRVTLSQVTEPWEPQQWLYDLTKA